MRIVHLSTHDLLGGAARAACRLHLALRAAGEDSMMLVNWKTSELDSVCEAPHLHEGDVFWAELIQRHYLDQNRAPVSNTFFSLGWPGCDLSLHPLIQRADIIHAHWTTLYQSPRSLNALLSLGKPVVVTLHDQRAFTGGCHYSGVCRGYEGLCEQCPQLIADEFHLTKANLSDQLQMLSSGNVTVVTPSRWMAEAARRSRVFGRAQIEVIPNSVDTTIFCPQSATEARASLGLPVEGCQLLFGADSSEERRKGFSELMESFRRCLQDKAFRELVDRGKLLLLTFGRTPTVLNGLPVPVRAFGRVESEATLSRIYSAADMFVLPSIEDNFPNTVLEAMSCGTPVAAFGVGGVPEMVMAGETGYLAKPGDVQELSRILISAGAHPERPAAMRPVCRQRIEERFTAAKQVTAHQRLYSRLLTEGTSHVESYHATSVVSSRGAEASAYERVFPQIMLHLLREDAHLLDSLPVLTRREVEIRFRRRRLLRRVKKHLRTAIKSHTNHLELIDRLSRELRDLQMPVTLRRDKLELFLMKRADGVLARSRKLISALRLARTDRLSPGSTNLRSRR